MHCTAVLSTSESSLYYKSDVARASSGVFMGHSAMDPSRRTPYFYEKSTCTAHGRLVQGFLLQAHLL